MEGMYQLCLRIAEKDDEAAFKVLFESFFPGLLSFATSFLKEKSLAEDVVEDVFIKLWENRKMMPTIKSLPYYLYIATKHAALNCINRQKRNGSSALDNIGEHFVFSFSTPESDMISIENLEKISLAINSLPPRCRLIFRLIKEDGLKHTEVAQLLNISVKTVEAQMTIALSKIIDYLRVNLPEYFSYYTRKASEH